MQKMVELSALGQNYFTPTYIAVFVLKFCFPHWWQWVTHRVFLAAPGVREGGDVSEAWGSFQVLCPVSYTHLRAHET